MNTDALHHLSAAAGVVDAYYDIAGQSHATTDAARMALLGAMGLLADGEDPQTALMHVEREAWSRFLPPVHVVRPHDGVPGVPVCLPATAGACVLEWSLEVESGTALHGTVRFDALSCEARREVDGVARERRRLALPDDLPIGYHRLRLRAGDGTQGVLRLVIAPATCFQPLAVQDHGRVWGPALQLYALRSQRNWGIGDFTDLRNALETAARAGAGVVGVNPLHALFPHNPEHASPYSPSSRNFYNVLYLDVETIPEFGECEDAQRRVAGGEFQARLRALRARELVDYAAVAAAKFEVLETLWTHFQTRHLGTDSARARAFRAYLAEGGKELERFALFNALQARFHADDPQIWGWPVWPHAYRDPTSSAVAVFRDAQRERVDYHAWLQWLADTQLQAVGHRAWELGLGVGLYMDLAVSVDRAGAETWSLQQIYSLDASVGAPPDDFNLHGQDWGLPPMKPAALVDVAYEPFIATLRHTMRHAGALRIDHVMGLMRLYWVPPGAEPAEGAYVRYPFHDLLGILALESQRNRCMVIGEDLGTVPDEVRDELGPLGVLSYRLLYFEREHGGGLRRPEDFPRQALVAVTTHDLPTMKSYWLGRDIEVRAALDLFPSEAQREAQVVARAQDRAWFLVALQRESLLPPGLTEHPVSAPEMTPELVAALHAYLARSPSQVMVLQLEDVLGQIEQVNLPGTTDEYPNWRRKLPLNLEDWTRDPRFATVTEALRRERGSGAQTPAALAAPTLPGDATAVIPRATYRLQLNRDFGFAEATSLVPYLARLGISHCYASPFLKARPGSAHGYDIIDHNALNPEIGSEQAFHALCDALQANDMGLILDLVPNHMGIMGADNGWWLDVLENGPASDYADHFDIDWMPLRASFRGRVVVPVLGEPYGVALERGGLALAFDGARGEFSVWYHEHRFPLDPREYPRVLLGDIERLDQRLDANDPLVLEFRSLVTAFGHLPPRHDTAPERRAERHRDKEIHKRKLAELVARSPDLARFVAENVASLNGGVGDPASFDALHALLEAQAWRLTYWRVASDEINYRRFFDINDLAALRMEHARVFDSAHTLVLQLVATGRLAGLRIDHPDGLHDPLQYFRRLQWRRSTLPSTPDATPLTTYLVVEKILASSEQLPREWPVHGTTGYDFANLVNGLLVDPASAARMDRIYVAFTGEAMEFDERLYHSRRLIIKTALAGELNVLATVLLRIAEADRRTSDFTWNGLRDAIREVASCFPVYRTYVSADGVSDADRRYIERAIATARERSPAADVSVFDFLHDVLLGAHAEGKPEALRAETLAFAMKFQQFSAPVMAKGMEDTAFYNYHRLASLNDVGGDPAHYGVSAVGFHRANLRRARQWPHAMLATSTHDSKRAEDVRARLNVLSECPVEWRRRIVRWQRANRARKRRVEGHAAPSRNDEYLLYQTLVGIWPWNPPDTDDLAQLSARVEAYMLKAAREAKAHTSWVNVDVAYEDALAGFVRAVLNPAAQLEFRADLAEFCAWLAPYGAMNSVSQVLLKLTCPGVPDLYQGCELWDFSLVDPDNRRAIDYALRGRELDTLIQDASGDVGALVRALLSDLPSGRLKLWLTWRCLELRHRHEALFRDGAYVPLRAAGARAEHLVAYARILDGNAAVVVAGRWLAKLSPRQCPPSPRAWGTTSVELPATGTWRNVLTNAVVNVRDDTDPATIPVAALFDLLPCALLIRE